MEVLLQIVLLVSLQAFIPANGQPYTAGCGVALQDIPNPSSDTCTAFFRCYNNRKYSLRCPLGQAFHFDRARCRSETEVDCPLQLQRFQAPAVPHYLRPLWLSFHCGITAKEGADALSKVGGKMEQLIHSVSYREAKTIIHNQYNSKWKKDAEGPQEREVEIRVVHVASGVDPNNLQFFNNGRQVPVTRQTSVQRGGHTLIAAQQQQQQGVPALNFQQTPILLRSPDGQLVQGQAIQGQTSLGQPIQGQPVQGQPVQGQVIQGLYFQPPAQTQVQG